MEPDNFDRSWWWNIMWTVTGQRILNLNLPCFSLWLLSNWSYFHFSNIVYHDWKWWVSVGTHKLQTRRHKMSVIFKHQQCFISDPPDLKYRHESEPDWISLSPVDTSGSWALPWTNSWVSLALAVWAEFQSCMWCILLDVLPCSCLCVNVVFMLACMHASHSACSAVSSLLLLTFIIFYILFCLFLSFFLLILNSLLLPLICFSLSLSSFRPLKF